MSWIVVSFSVLNICKHKFTWFLIHILQSIQKLFSVEQSLKLFYKNHDPRIYFLHGYWWDGEKKNDLFWLTAQWILHSDTEGSLNCVLMFSPTYYCIDLMAAKTYICDLIFLQHFFPLNQTYTQRSTGQKNAFNWSKSLKNSVMQEPLWKTIVCCICQAFFPLVNTTEINARKKRCIINKWFCCAKRPHSAKDLVFIYIFYKDHKIFTIHLLWPSINALQLSFWISIKEYFLLMSWKCKNGFL